MPLAEGEGDLREDQKEGAFPAADEAAMAARAQEQQVVRAAGAGDCSSGAACWPRFARARWRTPPCPAP